MGVWQFIFFVLLGLLFTSAFYEYLARFEDHLRAWVYVNYAKIRGFDAAKMITISADTEGIPLVDYGEIDGVFVGIQRNPVTVCQTALDHWDNFQKGEQAAKNLFLNCANWLINNAVERADYRVLEYNFPLVSYQMKPPWLSAMAQGQALQVLVKAHQLTREHQYLACAYQLAKVMFIEVKDGGVTTKHEADAWWYEECANPAQESGILNGMLFTLIGLHELASYAPAELTTEDHKSKKSVQLLLENGMRDLKQRLPLFDRGGHSYYDILKLPAGVDYHRLHIQLLTQLYALTGEPSLHDFADRWSAFQRRPAISRYFSHSTKFGTFLLLMSALSAALLIWLVSFFI